MRRRGILKMPSAGGVEFVGAYTLKMTSFLRNGVIAYDGNLTGGTGTNVAEGDLVIAYASVVNGINRTFSASGWTKLADLYTGSAQLFVFCKVMGPSPDTSISISFGDYFLAILGAHVFRGVDAVAPYLNVTTDGLANGATPNPDPPAITKSVASNLIYAVGGGWGYSNISVFTSSDLDGFQSQYTTQSNTNATGGAGYSASVENPAQFISAALSGRDWTALTLEVNGA